MENDALLLPNVKVTDYDAGAGTYNITTTGDSKLEFVNYSTKNDTSDERVGLQVTLKGSIRNEGTTASRNGWTHVGSAPTTDTADAKKYQLVVNGEAFTPGEDGIFSQATGITLNAPDLNNGNLDATTQLALDGSVTEANFSVNVGGDRYDYKTVEDSAQIGTISWIITSQNTVPVGP